MDRSVPQAKSGGNAKSDSRLQQVASTEAEIAGFLERTRALGPVAGSGRGRLIFAMDATMSRQPTWDMALSLQGEMFRAVGETGALDVQLVYFRGFGECRASQWVQAPEALARVMSQVSCRGGYTQIGKVLTHAKREGAKGKVNAVVYVGDCMEEKIDALAQKAGELGLIGVPVFLFQEGSDAAASIGFKEIARLTRGAHCRFDAGSASQLRELLKAIAVYASGGRRALRAFSESGGSGAATQLLEQMG